MAMMRIVDYLYGDDVTITSLSGNDAPAKIVLISLWLFLFAAQPKEYFLDEFKKVEQRSHKCVELRGNM
jgi:hypothetical protein